MSGQAAYAGDYLQRFGVWPAQAYEIEDVVWNGVASWLHVRRAGWLRWRAVFVVPYPVPRLPGHLIFIAKGRLSFMHPGTLEVLYFPAITGKQAEQQHYAEQSKRNEG